MSRTLAALVTLATLAAGCIAVPEDPNAAALEPTAAPPADDRIEGMTAEVSQRDAIVDCDDGSLTIPPSVCAERELLVTGRIGLDALPLELVGTNGAIGVRASEGDAWSFRATVRVRALTEDMAREALDGAWTWSHEDADGTHALRARPAGVAGLPVGMTSLVSTVYGVEVPEWLLLDLAAASDNGAIFVEAVATRHADLETQNGEIVVGGHAQDVRARTSNGQIVMTLRPTASGDIDLATDNGQIVLNVPEGRAFGYDIAGKTGNGQVVIALRDGDVRPTEDGATFRTRGYEERAIQTQVALKTNNGQAVVSPA